MSVFSFGIFYMQFGRLLDAPSLLSSEVIVNDMEIFFRNNLRIYFSLNLKICKNVAAHEKLVCFYKNLRYSESPEIYTKAYRLFNFSFYSLLFLRKLGTW